MSLINYDSCTSNPSLSLTLQQKCKYGDKEGRELDGAGGGGGGGFGVGFLTLTMT